MKKPGEAALSSKVFKQFRTGMTTEQIAALMESNDLHHVVAPQWRTVTRYQTLWSLPGDMKLLFERFDDGDFRLIGAFHDPDTGKDIPQRDGDAEGSPEMGSAGLAGHAGGNSGHGLELREDLLPGAAVSAVGAGGEEGAVFPGDIPADGVAGGGGR